MQITQNPGPQLLLVAALVASLAKQLAVLLLRHALATLLDNGTHRLPPAVETGAYAHK